jgi:hypothetical protein
MSALQYYALVDCAASPGRIGDLRHHVASAGVVARCLFAGRPEAIHADAAPWLVALPRGALQQPVERWRVTLGGTAAGVTRVWAAGGFDALFNHLQACLELRLPDGQRALMRFYCPRAWRRYGDVLTPAQQRDLLGPVRVWETTLQGRPVKVRADPETEPSGTGPLQLSAGQYASLSLPDAADWAPAMAAEVRHDYPDATFAVADDALRATVHDSYRHAVRALRITHLPTLVRWVKADVAWARTLRDHAVTGVWFNSTDQPNVTAADLLALLASPHLSHRKER